MHQITSYIPSECVTASPTNGYNVSKSLPIAHDTDPSSRAAASIKYLESEADRRARWAELLYEWQRRHRGDMSGLSLGATVWMDELKDPAYATMRYFDDANSVHDSHLEDSRPSRYAESWPNGESRDAKVRERNAKIWKDLANGKYDANGVRIRKPKPRVEEKLKPRPKGKYWVWKSEFAVAETPKRKVVTRKEIKENYVQVGSMWIHKSNFFLEEMPEATNTKNGAGLEENLDNVTTEEPVVSDEAPRFNNVDWQSAADH
ncbi:hypothetical protein W97_04070 [Coniosporium apollinis CBS 100218]|uniref:Uncharacterized protein n=1 Tax=Coniosporium apollinis (strain CBS 100218) TaxID=1168221 RepID=R7YT38_CONA1|nr:uncharacterized protein W97_04070 [Coniosporium apollinis CBS 100218]EON64836.1 hypothetical protein W97_04070 [Coniosporium apollinis CBS 100218]